MADRFDFEQLLLRCWNFSDDTKELAEHIDKYSLSEDEIVNALIGMSEIYNRRFETLFNMFEDLIRKGEI